MEVGLRILRLEKGIAVVVGETGATLKVLRVGEVEIGDSEGGGPVEIFSGTFKVNIDP